MGPRAGNTLVIVLAIALLLAAQLAILFSFSSSGFRHVEKSNAHIRAISLGESAFSAVLGRLKSAAWKDRWFRDAPFSEQNVALLGGHYTAYVAGAADDPARKLVDVWIESRFETSLAAMYWQVLYVDDTLDFTAQVYPRFFTHLDADDPTPFNGAPGPATTFARDQMEKQRRNRDRARAKAKELDGIPGFPGVVTALSIPGPAGQGRDTLDRFGGPDIAGPDYITQARGALPPLPGALAPPSVPALPPPPTAVPTPTPTPTAPTVIPTATPTPSPTPTSVAAAAASFPNPNALAGPAGYSGGIVGVIEAAFVQNGLLNPNLIAPPLGNDLFGDGNASNARQHWAATKTAFEGGGLGTGQFKEFGYRFFEELGKTIEKGGPNRAAAEAATRAVLDYIGGFTGKSYALPPRSQGGYKDAFEAILPEFQGVAGSLPR